MTFPYKAVGKSKHSNAKRTACLHAHMHDSKREAARCNLLHVLQSAGRIHALKVHPFFAFIIDGEVPIMGNGHKMGVTLDFSYVEDGALVAEDVKGRSKLADSRDWPLRKALFKHIYRSWDLREVRS